MGGLDTQINGTQSVPVRDHTLDRKWTRGNGGKHREEKSPQPTCRDGRLHGRSDIPTEL